MAYDIPLFELNFDTTEESAVVEVLRSRWISMGPKTAELEHAFAAHIGSRHAIALGSCTAALHLALAALGIGPGDEVIVPSLTFVATANAVGYVGARPVFADITSRDDFSLDPAHVRQLVGPRTRAVIPMHYAGFPCDMDALVELCREKGLALVEDDAHAPDAKYRGRAVGTFGDAGCFSFFANKNLACAEGGMVVTDRDDVAERVRLMRSHGMTSLSFDRARGHATEYDVIARGYNYRLDDIRAALALSQLAKLPEEQRARARLYQRYLDALADVEGLSIPYREAAHHSSYYVFPILIDHGGVERRNALRRFLADRGIQTSVHYPPAHRFSIYADPGHCLPRTDWVSDHEVTLPFFGAMTDVQVTRVVQTLRDGLQQVV